MVLLNINFTNTQIYEVQKLFNGYQSVLKNINYYFTNFNFFFLVKKMFIIKWLIN